MKKLMFSYLFLICLCSFIQHDVFAGEITNANFLKTGLKNKTVDIVFIINRENVSIKPIVSKKGYYHIHVGKIGEISYISNPKYNLAGTIPVEKFVNIDWNNFHPNAAVTANLSNNSNARKTWLFTINNAQYDNENGLVLLAKAKQVDWNLANYKNNDTNIYYDVTVFIDGFPDHFHS